MTSIVKELHRPMELSENEKLELENIILKRRMAEIEHAERMARWQSRVSGRIGIDITTCKVDINDGTIRRIEDEQQS